jgi:hypothetical protein
VVDVLSRAQEKGFAYLTDDAAHNLGIVEKSDTAIRWNEPAITIAEKSENKSTRGWWGLLYNNLA